MVKTGSYSRTHPLRRLIRGLAKYTRSYNLSLRANRLFTKWLGLKAYVASRYIPHSYEEKEVQSLHRFIPDRFKRLVDEA